MKYISIHALREEGDLVLHADIFHVAISIHALREEGDSGSKRTFAGLEEFLSTPSARRATKVAPHVFLAVHISIHALREEGDQWKHPSNLLYSISIHALREEGDQGWYDHRQPKTISIHALREEGDSKNRDKISIFL